MREAELRPRGVGELLDLTFNLYFRNILRFALTAAIVLVPVIGISLIVYLIALSADPASDPGFLELGDNTAAVNYGAYTTATVISIALQVLSFWIVAGATVKAVADAYRGRDVMPGSSVVAALRRMHSLIWIAILFTLGVTVASFFLLLPGIYLFVAWSLAVPVLMVDGIKGTKAIRRSMRLIRSHWWKIFAVYLVGVIVLIVVQIGTTAIAELLAGSTESAEAFEVISHAVQAVLAVFSTPFQAALIAVVYFDMRVRKEGLDLEVMAGELDEGGGGAAAELAPAAPETMEAPKDA